MQQIILILLSFIILAVTLTMGAVFIVIFTGAVAGFALYVFIRTKLLGKPLGNMRFYRYESRATRTRSDTPAPDIKVIEAEFEEIEKH